MKLTKQQLKQIIKEELEAVMHEGPNLEAARQARMSADHRADVARRKKEKEDEDRRRGSYYRHQPPDREESYPGEFDATHMEEGESDPMTAVGDYEAGKKPYGDGGAIYDVDAMSAARERFNAMLVDMSMDELQALKDALKPEHPLYDDVASAMIQMGDR